MHFNKFINRSSSRLILIYSTLLFAVVVPKTNGDSENRDTESENIQNPRAPRQFFSILKNIIQQTQKFQQQQPQQQFQNPSLNPYQDPYYNQYFVGGLFSPAQDKIHNVVSSSLSVSNDGSGVSPNYQQQSQYPMQNYQLQQHSSVPYYNDNLQLQSQQQLQLQQQQQFLQQQNPSGIGGFGGSPSPGASSISPALLNQGINMLSKLGLGNVGLPGDLDLSTVANLVNFGAFEGMLGRVNQFDKLQCIPRMICQMVAKRNEDQALRDSTSTTTSTTSTTERTRTKKPKKRTRDEYARFIKIGGVDTALEQFVQFLDLMQLKDWSIYPYVKGINEGNQVQRSGDCAQKFNSCPFSDDQLVYYFNNYNGGLFQSVRSGRNLLQDSNFNKLNNSQVEQVAVVK